MTVRIVVALAAMVAAAAPHAATPTPRIAIIIDDVGYRSELDRRALSLPEAVAVAVLPHAPNARRIAAAAAAQSRDVLVHLPMQSLRGPAELAAYDPLALHLDTTRDELRDVVARALEAVPEARGVNNHMGSLLTQHPGHMRWLMQTLACYRDLYFIDSYTTHRSVALREAQRHFVPARRRDVFLDDATDAASVREQFQRLVDLAHRRGSALAIGHPQRETLAVLEQELTDLARHGVALVPATALLDRTPGAVESASQSTGNDRAP